MYIRRRDGSKRIEQPYRILIDEFLASGAEDRLKLAQLPGYAPDLNPDEGVWKPQVRGVEEPLCYQILPELVVELRKAKERLRHKRDVILSCIRQPGFEVQESVLRSVNTVIALSFSPVGAMIAPRLPPRNPIGWLFCAIGFFGAMRLFTAEYAIATCWRRRARG